MFISRWMYNQRVHNTHQRNLIISSLCSSPALGMMIVNKARMGEARGLRTWSRACFLKRFGHPTRTHTTSASNPFGGRGYLLGGMLYLLFWRKLPRPGAGSGARSKGHREGALCRSRYKTRPCRAGRLVRRYHAAPSLYISPIQWDDINQIDTGYSL